MYRLNDVLLTRGLVTDQHLNAAQQSPDRSLVKFLVRENIVSADILADILAELLQLSVVDLTQYEWTHLLASARFFKELLSLDALTLKQYDGMLDLAVSDPSELALIDEVQFRTGLSVQVVLVRDDQLRSLLKKIRATVQTQDLQHLASSKEKPVHDHTIGAMSKQINKEPLVRFVNDILEEAHHKHATDIHFEPYADSYRIRFRIDGLLHDMRHPPKQIAQRLAARIKILAHLDIAEKRLPQDGRWQTNDFDARVSTCPVLHGEKIVIRLLNSTHKLLTVDALGFMMQQQRHFLDAIHKPQGLILVTGPTGSGKTATLYAAIQHLNVLTHNICTVEDPIEVNLPGINQVNINSKTSLNFARVLRAFLRQDPDIIMVGEIRDLETAQIALNAAQTGHLVLSTLHTTSSREAFARLASFGVSTYEMISSISLITAQRLLRKLCPFCKIKLKINKPLKDKFNLNDDDVLYDALGCKRCHDGYRGRIAVHELRSVKVGSNLLYDDALIAHIIQMPITGLFECGLAVVKAGVSSLNGRVESRRGKVLGLACLYRSFPMSCPN